MPDIGDIYVPHVTEVGSTQERTVVKRNFVDRKRDAIPLQRGLESGSFNFMMTVDGHPENYSLEEQFNSIRGLTYREKADNAFEFRGRKGFLLFDSVDRPREANHGTREGNAEVTYLPDSDWQSGFSLNHLTVDNDFGIDTDGYVPVGVSAGSVEEYDHQTDTATSISPEISGWETARGAIDYYQTNQPMIRYEHEGEDYADSEKEGPIRVYDHQGSATESDWMRVFGPSDRRYGSLVISNGIIRLIFDHPDDNLLHLHWYDGTNWNDAGTIDRSGLNPAIDRISGYEVIIGVPNGQIELRKGSFAARFYLTGVGARLELNTSDGDYPWDSSYDDADGADTDIYMWGSNTNTNTDYLMLKPHDTGSKTAETDADGNQVMYMTGFDSDQKRNFFAGIYPNSLETDYTITVGDLSHQLITDPIRSREVIQR